MPSDGNSTHADKVASAATKARHAAARRRAAVRYVDVRTWKKATGETVLRYHYRRKDAEGNEQRILIAAPDGTPLAPDQPGFVDAWAQINRDFEARLVSALVKPAADGPRTIANLVGAYLASKEFAEKGNATRKEYARVLGEISRRYGTKPVAGMEPRHVRQVRDEMAEGGQNTRGNKAVALLSVAMEFARVPLGWRQDNPCARPKRLASGPGIPAWTLADYQKFLAAPGVGEPMKRLVMLLAYTGLRIGDAVALPKSARAGDRLVLTTAKTGAEVSMKMAPELKAALDAAPASEAPTLLYRANGSRWTADFAKHMLTEAVAEAGLPKGRSAHGLRKLAHNLLAQQGASDAQIESMIPHASANLVRYYRRSADRQGMADAAVDLLSQALGASQAHTDRNGANRSAKSDATDSDDEG